MLKTEALMAKKRSEPTTEGPAKARSIVNLKGTEAYQVWISGVSKKTHIPISSIFRLAIAEWAERNNHGMPPEK